MIVQLGQAWLGWVARSALARQVVIGLVMTLLALTSGVTGGGATTYHRDRALRSELQHILDDYLATRRGPEGITGISAFVSLTDGKPAISVFAGATSRSGSKPIDRQTLFQIGSNTKAFTAALILKLEAEGHLDIDQTVGDWLPQYPAWKNNSIRQLLNMTSDIPTYSEAPKFMRAQTNNMFRHYTPERLVAYAYPSSGNRLPPAKGWFYSNTNYILAGMIAAKAGGASYDELLRRKIFRPLQLDDTFYSSWSVRPAVIQRLASGYFENPVCGLYRPDCTVGPLAPLDGRDMREADLSWAGAAGGIISTPRDLARWVRALFGGRVLPPKQLKEMLQLVSTRTGRPLARATAEDPSGFSLGLVQLHHPEFGRFWFYEGETLGYRATFGRFPQHNLIMTIMTNSQPPDGEDQIRSLIEDMYQAVMRRR